MATTIRTTQALLARLAAQPHVAGIIRYGQRPVRSGGPTSPARSAAGGDLDLCVVVDQRPDELESLHLHIGTLPFDLNLRTWPDLQAVERGEPLTPIDGAICAGEVLYDRDGDLAARLRALAARLPVPPPPADHDVAIPMNAPDAAAEFHQRTKHTWRRLRADSGGLDWGNQPFPFKLYPDLEPLPLPRQLPDSSLPATEVLAGHVPAAASALDLAGLARLLFFAAGVTRILHGVPFCAAPSAGALYPIELYAVCGPLPGLPAGVYHFEPAEFALRRLRDGDVRARLAAAAAAPAVAGLPLSLVLTGIPWRTTWKYRERGYRHLFWDAGAIVANLLALAAAAGWDARVLLGFVDQEVSGLLGIGRPEEYPLGLVTVAAPAVAQASGIPPLKPISPRTRPLSRSPRGYPLGAAAQRAGELPSVEAVSAWRSKASRLRAQPGSPTLPAADARAAHA